MPPGRVGGHAGLASLGARGAWLQLARQGRLRLRLGALVLRLHVTDAAVADALARALPLPPLLPPDGPADLHLALTLEPAGGRPGLGAWLRRRAPRLQVWADGALAARGAPADAVALVQLAMRRWLRQSAQLPFLPMPLDVLCRQGLALVLLPPGGDAGQRARAAPLVNALVEAGWTWLGPDPVLCELGSGLWHAAPALAHTLPAQPHASSGAPAAGAAAAAAAAAAGLDARKVQAAHAAQAAHPDPGGLAAQTAQTAQTAHTAPMDPLFAGRLQPVWPAWLVQLPVRPSAESAVLADASPTACFAALAAATPQYANWGLTAFRQLGQVVDQCGCHRLASLDPALALPALRQLTDQPPRPPRRLG